MLNSFLMKLTSKDLDKNSQRLERSFPSSLELSIKKLMAKASQIIKLVTYYSMMFNQHKDVSNYSMNQEFSTKNHLRSTSGNQEMILSMKSRKRTTLN